MNRIFVIGLIKDTIIRNKILDRTPINIIRVQFLRKIIKLQGDRGRV